MAKTVAKAPMARPAAPKPGVLKTSAASIVTVASLPSTSLASTSLAKGALANHRVVRVSSRGFNLKGRSKWLYASLAAIMLLVTGGVAYAFGLIGPKTSTRSQMAAIDKKLRNPDLTKEEKDALEGQQFKLMIKSGRMPPGGFDVDGGGFGGGFGGRGMNDDQMKNFMAMPEGDQVKELDKRIDDMLQRQKDREARDAKNGVKSGDQSSAGKDGRGGGGGDGGGRGRGGRGGGDRDPNIANPRKNRMLSVTPADSRAQRGINRQMRQAFGNMLQARAQQRGVTLPQGGGGGGGFGGRGGRG